MSCFSLEFWFKVGVCIILAIALWRIMLLFLPYLESKLPSAVVSIINIIIWAGIAILCLVVIFFFLSCIFGLVMSLFGGGNFLPFRRSDIGFFVATEAGMFHYQAERQRRLSSSRPQPQIPSRR